METFNVPCVPGSNGEVKDVNDAHITAKQIGFPVLLKAAAGGGGIGMKIVSSDDQLETLFLQAKSEAKKSFNDFGMLAARDYWFESWIKRVSVNTVMNLIPVDRASNKEKELSIKDSEALCNAFMEYEQRNLILFPEGTRGNPGELLPFKKGAARFALNLNKPILPAVIYGSHKIWPRGKMFFGLPTKIKVFILEPIYPDSFLSGHNPTEKEIDLAISKMTKTLEKKIKDKVLTLYE